MAEPPSGSENQVPIPWPVLALLHAVSLASDTEYQRIHYLWVWFISSTWFCCYHYPSPIKCLVKPASHDRSVSRTKLRFGHVSGPVSHGKEQSGVSSHEGFNSTAPALNLHRVCRSGVFWTTKPKCLYVPWRSVLKCRNQHKLLYLKPCHKKRTPSGSADLWLSRPSVCSQLPGGFTLPLKNGYNFTVKSRRPKPPLVNENMAPKMTFFFFLNKLRHSSAWRWVIVESNCTSSRTSFLQLKLPLMMYLLQLNFEMQSFL